ncbi:MAG TPA: RNA-binding protein [Ignavibacteria bacterium]|nr:RNA-binding protein [Ignavibacteria bacterium]
MKIYVGNIARESTEAEVKSLFEEFGAVTSINLLRDDYTKMLKGFGFIEMPDDKEGENAIKSLNGQLFNSRPLSVSVAKPRTDNKKPGGSFNRGNRSGGGYMKPKRYNSDY